MNKKIFLLGILFFLASFSSAQAETKTVNAILDSGTTSAHPDDNYGTLQSMTIKSYPDVMQGFVKFNYMSYIPFGSTVQRARLKIFNEGFICDDMRVYAQRITSNWSERSITYHASPDFTSNDQASLVLSKLGEYETWDVTRIVKGWVENQYLNYGFKLYYYSPTHEDCYAQLLTRESDKRPLLEITYTEPASPLYDIKSLVIGSKVNISWKTQEDSRGAVYYRVFRSGADWKLKSSSEVARSHSVQLTGLQANTRYEYKVYSRTVSSQETTSNIQYFQTSSSFSSSSSSSSGESSEEDNRDQDNGEQLRVYNVIKDVLSPTSARIKWWSNVAGTSWVLISDSADDSTPNSEYIPYGHNDEVEVHEIIATGLSSNTTYSYKVLTVSPDGQSAISSRKIFTTYEQEQGISSENGEEGDGSENGDAGDEGDVIDVSQDHFETGNEEDPSVLAGVLQEADSAQENEVEGDSKNAEKKSDVVAQENSDNFFWSVIPFFLARTILPLVIMLVVIALIILFAWKKSHKKDASQDAPEEVAMAKDSQEEVKKAEVAGAVAKENVPEKSQNHAALWIVAIILIFFVIIFLKNLLTFFIPMPF